MSETDWTDERDEDAPEPPTLAFPSLPEFVTDFFVTVAVRHTQPGKGQWCSRWWDHEEAVLRLEALWDAFEALRLEPGTGMAVWIRDYLDPAVGALTNDETSPFRECDDKRGVHVVTDPWPLKDPPEGMFRRADPVTASETPQE